MKIHIAIDCMGGDHGPSVTVPAACCFLDGHRDVSLILVGQQDQIYAQLSGKDYGDRLQVVHAPDVVGMDESPMLALKNKKHSSMRIAINLVKQGDANACVSAGNTGALMAISRFVLKMLPGIDRPAICPQLPTTNGHVHMLDLGANVDCTPEHLLQFAIMGAMLVSAVDHKERPTVGLLNIGEEDIKGNDVVKAAADLLKASDLNFVGNVEGDGIFKGEADVVVCDGFVGNVALKASEGIARMLASFLRQEFRRNIFTMLVALIALPVLNSFKKRVDPGRYNGAILLGLRGISVKSHGSADIASFAKAIERACEAASNRVVERIAERIRQTTPATVCEESA